MSSLLTVTGSFALVWLSTWLLCSLTLTVLYPLLRRHLLRLHPADGSALLLLLLAFPVLLSLVSTLLLFTPGLETSLVSDHCHGNCQAHIPLVNSAGLAGTGLVLLAVLVLILGSRLLFHVRVGRRLMAQLATLARPGQHYWLLDDDDPLVFTLGWWRNRIYLTRGLLRRCSQADIAIVLAHEKEHVRRLDNLRLLLARLFLLVVPRGLAGTLFADLHALTESACDLAAAEQSDPLDVAGTLLKVQRLVPSRITYHEASITSAFTGAEIERRVQALLDYHAGVPNLLHGVRLCALALLVCSVLLVDPLHHSVELLLHLAGN
ncbi:MAG: M56 family metallopeptidase [Gammaproteobacteria bacterium]|nr:M56 family metallopeptidase [Pseudomonadales bacterium]MCP5348114.1 M56 family metallopeptidase [Pseudomonadales bacterium]